MLPLTADSKSLYRKKYVPNRNRVSIFVNSMKSNSRTAQYIVRPTLPSLRVRRGNDAIFLSVPPCLTHNISATVSATRLCEVSF